MANFYCFEDFMSKFLNQLIDLPKQLFSRYSWSRESVKLSGCVRRVSRLKFMELKS
jgi:hypothetical protein